MDRLSVNADFVPTVTQIDIECVHRIDGEILLRLMGDEREPSSEIIVLRPYGESGV